MSIRYFSARIALPFLFFGALWFILCRQLSGEWLVNEQYNYGWFVPFFAVYLFWLRWQDRPAVAALYERRINDTTNDATVTDRRYRRVRIAAAIGILALLLLFPIRLFEIGTPEWRPLGWIHAASVATLTLLYLWCVGGRPWLRHFAFPVAFFFVAVPWVTPVETPVIQGLMRMVAAVAAETVTLFGIPTQLEGNLIRVSSGLVGVNEACSGVRSLQTALMIGLLFGELKRLSTWRRAALVASAIAIAIAANLCRAVFLVWIAAARNISEVSRWHELAGYAIVGLVFVGTVILAMLLSRKTPTDSQSIRNPQSATPASLREAAAGRAIRNPTFIVPASWLVFALCWIVAVELGAHFWYRAHERNLVATTRWTAQWPEASPNFRELKIDEEVRRQLRFDQGHAASWTLSAANSQGASGASKPNTIICLLYLFRWNPGRNSALLANLHRPDVCLPASGWIQVADTGVRNYPVSAAFELPFRHFEFQRSFEGSSPQTAHAFYCLSEDRAAVSSAPRQGVNLVANSPGMSGSRSEWTRAERLRTVLEGRRHLGQQVIEAIFISSEPFSAAEAEAHLRNLVRDVIRLREAD